MYDWVLNKPLRGFVQDAPGEEVAIAPVAEILTAITWQNYKLVVSSTTDTLLKNQIFGDVFLVENYEIMLYERKPNYFGKTLLINFISIWNNLLIRIAFLPSFRW